LILSASSRVTEAFNVVEGTLLPTLARENLQGFKPRCREIIRWP
jgi:hypothetical protein